VTEKHQAYAREVGEELRRLGVRVHVDDRSEKLGYRIREAQVQKVPYMLVVGDKEVAAKSVSVRHRHAGDLGPQRVGELGARLSRLATERVNQEEARTPSAGGVS
jgi:threonyl-tRNA synthetase